MIFIGCEGTKRSAGVTSRMKDLTGQRFGRLTVLYATEERDRKGSVLWMCQCDCGNTIKATSDSLKSGVYKSCGCLKKEYQTGLNDHLHRVDGTCIEWLENRKNRSDNASGFRGVFRTKNGKYCVSIGFKKKRFSVGTFDTYEDAVQARMDAEDMIYGGFIKSWNEWNKEAEKDPEWAADHKFVFDVEKINDTFCIHKNIG